jgi:hypothetical protein
LHTLQGAVQNSRSFQPNPGAMRMSLGRRVDRTSMRRHEKKVRGRVVRD